MHLNFRLFPMTHSTGITHSSWLEFANIQMYTYSLITDNRTSCNWSVQYRSDKHCQFAVCFKHSCFFTNGTKFIENSRSLPATINVYYFAVTAQRVHELILDIQFETIKSFMSLGLNRSPCTFFCCHGDKKRSYESQIIITYQEHQ